MTNASPGFETLPEEYDPFDIDTGTQNVFWADDVADRIEATDPTEPIVIKGGISPSGIPHLGNANEIILGYFVAEVLRERGYNVKQVFTTDDRDPLRSLPRKLADLDGNIVDLGDVDAAALGRNLGKPYTDIPDPFGCCESYGDHFSNLIADIATDLDIPIELVSNTARYEAGDFDDTIKHLLEKQELARNVLANYQDTVGDEYVPFNPICQECGKITETVTGVDLDAGTVDYRCTDLEAGDQTIDGCGHAGTVSIRDGKLPWRFEWVAQWDLLDVDFEPFGKDHAEGSWPSGVDIAKNVFGFEPPMPMVYEWFTLEDQAFSSSEGHVVLVSELLELVEPEVLLYFFAKDPTRARDFSIERLDQLVSEFDQLERIALGRETADPDRTAFAERVYPFLVETTRDERVRIPYPFAAVLGMVDDPGQWREVARREGHITDEMSDAAIETAMKRVKRARRWARRTNNEYNYELKRDTLPEVAIDDQTAQALDELAEFIRSHDDPEEIQSAIFEIARNHDIDVGDFFATGYRLFFDLEEGPRLGHFLAKLDKEFVINRLQRKK